MSVLPGPRDLASSPGSVGLPTCPGQSAAFTSAPLAAPLQLTGSATVRVRVSGAADITVFAKLYDVDQAGNATLPVRPGRAGAGDRVHRRAPGASP